MFWLVSQSALHRCRLELEDQALESASLFPFFDDLGRTQAVMITTEGSSRILLLDWSPDLFARRRLKHKRIGRRFTDLRDAELSDAEHLAHLWHFDPWWVLGKEPYIVHPAVPVLRQTNLPGYDRTFRHLWFDNKLSRAVFTGAGSEDSPEIRRFTPKTLAEAHRLRQETPSSEPPSHLARSVWRLRPFWE